MFGIVASPRCIVNYTINLGVATRTMFFIIAPDVDERLHLSRQDWHQGRNRNDRDIDDQVTTKMPAHCRRRVVGGLSPTIVIVMLTMGQAHSHGLTIKPF